MNTEVKEKNELEEYKYKTFEEIKHIDELGNEYWEARGKRSKCPMVLLKK